MLIFGAPSRYYQGPGCMAELGEILSGIGTRPAVVVDAFVLPLMEERLAASLSRAGLSARVLPFSGDVTETVISRIRDEIGEGAADLVVAIGGGKAIDVGKAVSHRLELPVATVPTAAANDAPTSKNYVIYDDNHALVEVAHLPENPRAVVVDSEIIASAPRALLVAGIGDAITKAFEAAQCYGVQGRNMFGRKPSLSALHLAEACYRTVRAEAPKALELAGSGVSSEGFERLLEAMFLMGGLGFESGGLSIAHAMTRGLSRVPGAAEAMHGHQVAYGLLVQFSLEKRSQAFMADVCDFYRLVGLSMTLADLGVREPGDAVLAAVAGPTLVAAHAKNFERSLTERDLVEAMRSIENSYRRP